MDEGRRPGGLTALAVINFVFGGYDFLRFAGCVIMLTTGFLPVEQAPAGDDARAEIAAEEQAELERVMTLGLRLGLLYGPIAGLLIASGVGYLRQGRVLGRYLGNAYAALSIASTALELKLIPAGFPGTGFTALSILLLIYPLVTLVLLNTTFRSDFA